MSISRDRDETFWATSTMAAIVFYSCSTRGNFRSNVVQSYGVRAIPRSVLIDRQGNVVYFGHPMNLPEALVEETLLQ